MTIDSTTKIFLGGVEQVKILKNGLVIWERNSSQPDYFYIENTYAGRNTITFTTTKTGSPSSTYYSDSVEYSKNGFDFTTLNFVEGTPSTITLEEGEKLYLRNDSGAWNYYASSSTNYHTTITGSQSHIVGGNIKSLVDYTDMTSAMQYSGCFSYLFDGDSTLTDSSNLVMDDDTMVSYAYLYTFKNCTSMTSTVATLPATTLAGNCYNHMYRYCSALTAAPSLPATVVPGAAYQFMFSNCTSLISAPSISAIEVGNRGMYSMFSRCTSITSAVLLVTTAGDEAFRGMFYYCSAFNSLTTQITDISATDCLLEWLNGVANTGTLYNNGEAPYVVDSASGIPVGWTEVKPAPKIDYFYIENTYPGENTLSVKTTGNSTGRAASVEWSKDRENWTTMSLPNTGMTSTITMNQGDKVYFRNDSGVFNTNTKYIYFDCTQSHNAGGDVSTLTDYNNIGTTGAYCNLFKDNATLVDASRLTISGNISDRCFQTAFQNCTSLTTAPALPATTLATYCYSQMFSGCTSLTTAPALPATTLATYCYNRMFYNCTSLTTAPQALPATTLAANCYYGMFQGCSSLTSVPELPATTLADNCYYNMFYGCTSLVNIPTLPGTVLGSSCYYGMFQNCTSLTTPATLPATNLASNCYKNMYYGCTSLTTTPALPATTLTTSCYYGMFQNCSSLTSVPALSATTLADSCYYNMFYGCTSLTSVPSNYLPVTTLETKCYYGMFQGCTSLTNTPTLPAMTLATYCYNGMFRGCTSLTTAPASLPATTLVSNCYANMFNGCTSLKIGPDIKATGATVSGCFTSMFNGCTSLYMVTTNVSTVTNSHMTNWMANVSPTGYFFNLGVATFASGTNGIPTGWTQYTSQYFFIRNTYSGTNTITVTTTDDGNAVQGTYATSVEYSENRYDWTTLNLTPGTPQTIPITQGQSLYFRNNSGKFNSLHYYTSFELSQSGTVGGNVNALLDYDNPFTVPLSNYCFYSLFLTTNSNSHITDVSKLILPSTTLAQGCYSNMFAFCSTITTVPSNFLPATTLADSCYSQMFWGCRGLTNTPELPATTLAISCYSGMFNDCRLLTESPVLPATTLVDRCYNTMFNACSSLNKVTTYADDISATLCIFSWLNGVASSGILYNEGSAQYPSGASGIPIGWRDVKGIDYLYVKNEYDGSNTITISNTMYDPHDENPEIPALDLTKCGTSIEYSKDKTNWTTLTITANSSNTIAMNTGETVYFRNDTGKMNYLDMFYHGEWRNNISTSNNSSVGGNIHTIIDYTGTNITTREVGCLRYLFSMASKIKDAAFLEIPSTTPVNYEYEYLFYDSGIVTPPNISPKTLAQYCYVGMFRSCHSLTSVPLLPATTLAIGCYIEMFYECTSLTTVPQNLLPATTLANSCYSGMFSLCFNLTNTPTLPATTLAAYCYMSMFSNCALTTYTLPALNANLNSNNTSCYMSMFSNCTSITSIPSNYLPSVNLADSCYAYMFEGCTSLTTIPSNLLPTPSLVNSCYSGMFQGCTSLTTLPSNLLPATTLAIGCYGSMFIECTSLTTVPQNLLPATNIQYCDGCYAQMFQNCTSLTSAPALPATDITGCTGCYSDMFSGCTSLVTAPVLYPQTLTTDCYANMFNGCTSLDSLTSYATDITATNCTYGWLNNVYPTGDFYNLGSATYPSSASGIPSGWTEHTTLPQV